MKKSKRKLYKKNKRKLKSKNTKDNDGLEVNNINIESLCMSHIIQKNPIVKANIDIRKQYLNLLEKYLRTGGWNRLKYVKAQMSLYENLLIEGELLNSDSIYKLEYYKHFILFDLLNILGFESKYIYSDKMKSVINTYTIDFPDMKNEKEIINKVMCCFRNYKKLNEIEEYFPMAEEVEYIESIYDNLIFKNKKVSNLMITANMSAGKSTFINALTGKYISLSQNMACTSKIHSIIGKPFNDGYIYKYDHDLTLMANKEELLNNNELNQSNKVIVSTYYDGNLGGKRIVINDSPGVNFSCNSEHKNITNKLIKSKKYNILVYLMNATQLGTNDEDEHLEFVRKNIGKKPVIFIINKIDTFNIEEENVMSAIKKQYEYIESKGFKNPIVCPVSSRAGYIAKISKYGKLSRVENRELYNYIDKFEQMKLMDYYNKHFPNIKIKDSKDENTQLLKTCGLSYVEKIIKVITEGGKINGTNLC